jgi:hypothetical protein
MTTTETGPTRLGEATIAAAAIPSPGFPPSTTELCWTSR